MPWHRIQVQYNSVLVTSLANGSVLCYGTIPSMRKDISKYHDEIADPQTQTFFNAPSLTISVYWLSPWSLFPLGLN